MKPEQDILAALRMLAESDRDKTASPKVEIRLRQVFRRKQTERVWKRAAAWTLAAAAVVAMIATYEWRPRPQPVNLTGTVQPAVQQSVAAPEIAHTASRPARKVTRARQAHPREIVTQFFPLVDIAPPFERGELVRVNLPAAAMRAAGLPVREDRLEDRIQADVLVSEEGLARAIRFVKYSQ